MLSRVLFRARRLLLRSLGFQFFSGSHQNGPIARHRLLLKAFGDDLGLWVPCDHLGLFKGLSCGTLHEWSLLQEPKLDSPLLLLQAGLVLICVELALFQSVVLLLGLQVGELDHSHRSLRLLNLRSPGVELRRILDRKIASRGRGRVPPLKRRVPVFISDRHPLVRGLFPLLFPRQSVQIIPDLLVFLLHRIPIHIEVLPLDRELALAQGRLLDLAADLVELNRLLVHSHGLADLLPELILPLEELFSGLRILLGHELRLLGIPQFVTERLGELAVRPLHRISKRTLFPELSAVCIPLGDLLARLNIGLEAHAFLLESRNLPPVDRLLLLQDPGLRLQLLSGLDIECLLLPGRIRLVLGRYSLLSRRTTSAGE